MKITTRILVALGSLAGAVPGWTSPAQTSQSPKHEEITVWNSS